MDNYDRVCIIIMVIGLFALIVLNCISINMLEKKIEEYEISLKEEK